MKEPLEWVWRTDPDGLPDDDHGRCIAASGKRWLSRGSQLFRVTTRPSTELSSSILRIDYMGSAWAQGLPTKFWCSEPFANGRLGNAMQHAAGVDLLARVAAELAAA